jgi:hypothetical protein
MELPNGRYLLEFVSLEMDANLPLPQAPSENSLPVTSTGTIQDIVETPAVLLVPETGAAEAAKRRGRFYAGLTVLVIVAAGILAYRSHRQATRNAFWDPVLGSQMPIVLSIGINKVDAEVHPNRRLVTFANASAYAKVAVLLDEHHRASVVKPDVETTMDDLRDSTSILIGSPSNFWTAHLSSKLRYEFVMDTVSNTNSVFDTFHPEIRWTVPRGVVTGDDYAMVGMVASPATGGTVVFLSGLGSHGTAAAAEFLTESRYRDALNRILGRSANVQIILKAPVIRGVIGSPEVVASYTW